MGKTMLGKKNESNPAAGSGGQTLNTIIGRGTVFEGDMKVENSVRIDGTFKGDLVCSGALTISQTGEAYAQLEGKDIYINGVVRGTVRAEKVRLDSQAKFVGDVHAATLVITEGAVFHGKSAMESESIPGTEPAKNSGAASNEKAKEGNGVAKSDKAETKTT